jgi:hypothetical protein
MNEHEQMEEMANSLVPDEQYARDPESWTVHPQRENQPRWCPEGLTKTQKRQVQRLRNLELWEEEQRQARG